MDFCGIGINPITRCMIIRWKRNDLFALVFSTPCMGLFFYATLVNYNPYLIAVAIGIFCYGAFYFIFHDLIVHQRIKFRIKEKANTFNVLFMRIIFTIANIPRMDVRPLVF